ncbi:biotin synthase BioB [Inquilinus limosus]|uniref:biotin synthase BioB n=1 Tax=Inquilinus limosus TaxID=171674 RepID=UPI000429D98D|nr:biotin synthase BioB [Inquilinus limosus]
MTAAAVDSRAKPAVRFDRTRAEALYSLPFPELLHQAQLIHRESFDPAAVETASLLSIKTGGCPEDCGYCSQSARHDTGVKATRLMDPKAVVERAAQAKAGGAGRFCMGAAWRSPKDRDLDRVCEMIAGVKALGLSTCVTLGMLTRPQADRLKAAGLDYYSHNVDTSPEFYGRIITTRTLQDRLETLGHVRAAGIKVCCGGIVGMGETVDDRLGMLLLLAGLDPHPESVPLNLWNEVPGTPVMAMAAKPDPIDFVRLVAVARILLPRSVLRLSAGRQYMSDEMQALCFLAGANSIFLGDVLLTTANPGVDRDAQLLDRLGLKAVTGGLAPAA